MSLRPDISLRYYSSGIIPALSFSKSREMPYVWIFF